MAGRLRPFAITLFALVATSATAVDLAAFESCAVILADEGADVDDSAHLLVAVDSIEESGHSSEAQRAFAMFVRANTRAQERGGRESWPLHDEARDLLMRHQHAWHASLPDAIREELRAAQAPLVLPYSEFHRGQLREIPVRMETLRDPEKLEAFLKALEVPNALIHPRRIILRPRQWSPDVLVRLSATRLWKRLYGIHLDLDAAAMPETVGAFAEDWFVATSSHETLAAFSEESFALDFPPTLRSLRFTGEWREFEEFSAMLLDESAVCALANSRRFPALRELEIPVGAPSDRCLARFEHLPQLEVLRWADADRATIAAVAKLEKLRELRVNICDGGWLSSTTPPPAVPRVRELFRPLQACARLRRLEIGHGVKRGPWMEALLELLPTVEDFANSAYGAVSARALRITDGALGILRRRRP